MASATIAASSPTPASREDLRVRRKWVPRKYRPGTAELGAVDLDRKSELVEASNHLDPTRIVRTKPRGEDDRSKLVELHLLGRVRVEWLGVGELGGRWAASLA